MKSAGEGRCATHGPLAALGFKKFCLTRKAGHSESLRPVNMPFHWQPRVAASISLWMVATAFNWPRLQLPTEAGVKYPGSGGRFHPR